MTLHRAAIAGVGLSFVFIAGAMAQGTFSAAPMQPGPMPPAPMQAAPQAPPPGGANPCITDFVPLRQEAEKRAGALKVAAARKAQRNEICNLITRFSEAEGKFAKYVEKNQTWCGIPPNIVAQIKANHAKTMQTRTNVCNGGMGAQGPAIPPGPGLSDALGTNRAPSATNTTTGKGGTFDTLSGNPIK